MTIIDKLNKPDVEIVQALNDIVSKIEGVTNMDCAYVQWHQQNDGDYWMTIILEHDNPALVSHSHAEALTHEIARAIDYEPEKIGVIIVKGGKR